MKITIHRGTDQIGGCVTEYEHEGRAFQIQSRKKTFLCPIMRYFCISNGKNAVFGDFSFVYI